MISLALRNKQWNVILAGHIDLMQMFYIEELHVAPADSDANGLISDQKIRIVLCNFLLWYLFCSPSTPDVLPWCSGARRGHRCSLQPRCQPVWEAVILLGLYRLLAAWMDRPVSSACNKMPEFYVPGQDAQSAWGLSSPGEKKRNFLWLDRNTQFFFFFKPFSCHCLTPGTK